MINKCLMKIGETRNPFLIFLPFLVLYTFIVIYFHHDVFIGDEIRYYSFAQNLLKGYYSPPHKLDLGNSPGYPMFILPFLAVKTPLIVIPLLNAILLYLSVVILFLTLSTFVSFRISMIVSIYWGLYFNSFEHLPFMLNETISAFFATLLCYGLIRSLKQKDERYQWKYVMLAGFAFGYLALIKSIFGYVLLFILIFVVFLSILKFRIKVYRIGLIIMIISFLFTLPYLVYTYSLTGKLFYWGSNSGNNLYWMTTPYVYEYGSWYPYHKHEYDSASAGLLMPGGEEIIKRNHKANHEKFFSKTGLEQDAIYLEVAMSNIRDYPLKFIQNCFNNLSRIIFNFPYSYSLQNPNTLLRIPFNGIIILLLLFSMFPAWVKRNTVPFNLFLVLLIPLVYLGGSVFGSAETRMFTIAVPFFLIWIAFFLDRSVKYIFKWK